jgi:hypothetical protein
VPGTWTGNGPHLLPAGSRHGARKNLWAPHRVEMLKDGLDVIQLALRGSRELHATGILPGGHCPRPKSTASGICDQHVNRYRQGLRDPQP